MDQIHLIDTGDVSFIRCITWCGGKWPESHCLGSDMSLVSVTYLVSCSHFNYREIRAVLIHLLQFEHELKSDFDAQ